MRRLVLAATVAALAAGCAVPVASKVANDAVVTISGAVNDTDGNPFVGGETTLWKLSFDAAVKGRVAEDGSFGFVQKGIETKNWLGQPHMYTAEARRADGARVTWSFAIIAGDIGLPHAQLWDGVTLEPDTRTHGLGVSWTSPKRSAGSQPAGLSLIVTKGDTTKKQWEADGDGSDAGKATIPGYVLDNDQPYRLQASVSGGPLDWWSAYHAFKTGTAAASRVLRPVSAKDDADQAQPSLIDGRVEEAGLSAGATESAKRLVIDLGARQAVSRVVLYHATGSLDVDVTDDPTGTFSADASGSGKLYRDLDLKGASGRYVVLKSFVGTRFDAIHEVRIVGP